MLVREIDVVVAVQDLRHARRGQQRVVVAQRGLLARVRLARRRHRQVAEIARQTFDVLDVEPEVVEIDLGRVVARRAR